MKKIFIVSLMLIPFLLGCSGNGDYSKYPYAEAYPATNQQRMQAAHHWDELAKIEAKNMLCRLPDKTTPIYIKNMSESFKNNEYEYTVKASPFKEAFRNLIISQLVKQNGVIVQNKPTSKSVIVDYDVQVLTHKDRGYLNPKPGTYALIAANIAMIYSAQYWHDPELLAIPLVAQLEWFNQSKGTKASPVEVIVTTRASNGNNIIMSDSRIYYINVGDADHYMDIETVDMEIINRKLAVVSD